MNRNERVVNRYIALKAASIVIKNSPNLKISSTVSREIDERVLSVFGEGMLRQAHNKKAVFKVLTKKLKELYQAFQKAPNLWKKFKEVLGITTTNPVKLYVEVSRKFQALLDEGSWWWDTLKGKLKEKSKLINFMFMYASNAPTFTSIVNGVIEKHGGKTGPLARWLSSTVKPIVGRSGNISDWIDNFLENHPLLKIITMPAKAYLYWVIWINVTEISWKISDLLKGFLGLNTWSELLQSLPESGVGFIVTLLFPGIPGGWVAKSLSIGWNAILLPAVGLQLYALYTKGLVNEQGQPV